MVTQKKKPSVKRRQCGTVAGYQQHSKRGEEQCDPCRAAQRVYSRERKAAKRGGEPPRVTRVDRRAQEEANAAIIEELVEPEPDGRYPAFLRKRGRQMWDDLNEQFEFTPQVRELAVEACRLADRLERMAAMLSSEHTMWFELGEPEELKSGETQVHIVVNNVIGEARQNQSALAVLLNKIGVADKATAKTGGESLTDQLARKRKERQEEARAQAGEA